MLPNFEITNFRTFSHLRIERLGKVNLIVGKNNVGKTTLLEALRFYAMGSVIALRECLIDHDELGILGASRTAELDLRSLFHGRPAGGEEIDLGPLDEPNRRLRIRSVDVERVEESDGYSYEEFDGEGVIPEGEIFKGLIIQRNKTRIFMSPDLTQRGFGIGRYVGPAFIPARGVRESDLTQWWDKIVLTEAEDKVIHCLSSIAPVERITATEHPVQGTGRIFKVRLQGKRTPVPLKSLGGGPFRTFQLAVAIEYARETTQEREPSLLDEPGEEPWQRPGLLLIDEIENGIHYTVHADIWKYIFRLAQQYNLQVFATSHSWDCIEGFRQAASNDPESEAMLIRLESVQGKSRAVLFNEEELPIVTREKIEVR